MYMNQEKHYLQNITVLHLMSWLGSKQFVYEWCECLEWLFECIAWIDYCLLYGRTLVALGNSTNGKKSYKRKTKHVINTNAQFVTSIIIIIIIIIISFTFFWIKSIEISPGKLPLCTRHRGDFPGLNALFMHLFPSVTIELVKLHY